MHLADCCMAVSGSVSLELLYQAKPTVILYWINRPAYIVQQLFRKVKYITLVNLLAEWEDRGQGPGGESCHTACGFADTGPRADAMLFPEYLTCEDRSVEIAAHMVEWLTDPQKRQSRVADLERLKEKVAHGGASARGAEYVLQTSRAGRCSNSRRGLGSHVRLRFRRHSLAKAEEDRQCCRMSLHEARAM